MSNKLTKANRKAYERVARAGFAEHLYEGLTIRMDYGLIEAARHWICAKQCIGEYYTIQFDKYPASLQSLIDYDQSHDHLIKTLEDYFQGQGIDVNKITWDELDALAVERNER